MKNFIANLKEPKFLVDLAWIVWSVGVLFLFLHLWGKPEHVPLATSVASVISIFIFACAIVAYLLKRFRS